MPPEASGAGLLSLPSGVEWPADSRGKGTNMLVLTISGAIVAEIAVVWTLRRRIMRYWARCMEDLPPRWTRFFHYKSPTKATGD